MIVKRLYRFMLRSFLPLLLMTFLICLFIVLMQFLWRYIDELVGKGLEIHVIGELFFYAALTMVPTALPLSILLASLMVFGNLGERFELTAMKASGLSLMKVMRPLIIFIFLLAVGAFFFQNYVLPVAQAKMYTLLFSVRQKSPELEIPEGVFYDQIPGYNFYVQEKNRETGTLYDMMIYDVSRGFDNARIILADSGHLKLADDKEHLFLQLHSGEQFENLRQSGAATSANSPYRRETFDLKEILLKFDANFNRMDESGMRNQYVGKNIAQLQATIDSVTKRVDSIGADYATELQGRTYVGVPMVRRVYDDKGSHQERVHDVKLAKPIDLDSLFYHDRPSMVQSYFTQAISHAQRTKQEFEFRSYSMEADRETIRRHEIEKQKKFTLSFACIIFFFIGAPLGAIIRKGGLGTPLVISVLLFIVYYIIDNSGYKMARDGKVEVWMGIWLSSAVLLPLGIFFTYKAMNDSAVFDVDALKNRFRRLTGRMHRELEVKEFTMQEVEPATALAMVENLQYECEQLQAAFHDRRLPQRIYYFFRRFPLRDSVQATLNAVVDYLANSRRKDVIDAVNMYPFQLTVRTVGKTMRVNQHLIKIFNRQINDESNLRKE